MFDFAWSEIGLIGLVAVLVLGPKELPAAMRTMGRFTRQARRLAGDLRSQVDDLMREAELDDVRRTLNQVKNVNVSAQIDKLINADDELGPEFEASIAKAQQDMAIAPPQVTAAPEVHQTSEPTVVLEEPTPQPVSHGPETSEAKPPPSEGHS